MRSVGLEARAGIAALTLGVLAGAAAGETATAEEAHPAWQAPGLHLGGVRLGMTMEEASAAWKAYAATLDPNLRAPTECPAPPRAPVALCMWQMKRVDRAPLYGSSDPLFLGQDRGYLSTVSLTFASLGEGPLKLVRLSGSIHAPARLRADAFLDHLSARFGADPVVRTSEQPMPSVSIRSITRAWVWDESGGVVEDRAAWEASRGGRYTHDHCRVGDSIGTRVKDNVLRNPERAAMHYRGLRKLERDATPSPPAHLCPPRAELQYSVNLHGFDSSRESLSDRLASVPAGGDLEISDPESIRLAQRKHREYVLQQLREAAGPALEEGPEAPEMTF